MTHVKDANPTVIFIDHGITPRLDHLIANEPTLVGTHKNQTELNYPWLLEFAADTFICEMVTNPTHTAWTAFAVYIPQIAMLIPFNMMGIAYQLGANLIGHPDPARFSRLQGGQIFPHPDNDSKD